MLHFFTHIYFYVGFILVFHSGLFQALGNKLFTSWTYFFTSPLEWSWWGELDSHVFHSLFECACKKHRPLSKMREVKQTSCKLAPWNERYFLTKSLNFRFLAAVVAVVGTHLAIIYKCALFIIKSWWIQFEQKAIFYGSILLKIPIWLDLMCNFLDNDWSSFLNNMFN